MNGHAPVFPFGPLRVRVRIQENQPDYRVWSVSFWKIGSPESERQVFFHMQKGFWFGHTAYFILALKLAWDFGGLFYGAETSYPGPAPRPLDLQFYVRTLKELSERFDLEFEVPRLWKVINEEIAELPEDGNNQNSIHNALFLLSEHGLPATVEFRRGSSTDPHVVIAWDATRDEPERKFRFHGLYLDGQIVSQSSLAIFFGMIGYYKSHDELVDLRNALRHRFLRRHGPKDWSPVEAKVKFALQRGKDYGVEDVQPGEPAL